MYSLFVHLRKVPVELPDQSLHVSHISLMDPFIFLRSIPFPADQILKAAMVPSAVEYFFNLILRLSIYDLWVWPF